MKEKFQFLTLSEEHKEAVLKDPINAAREIFDLELDIYQQERITEAWTRRWIIDDSPRDMSKSFCYTLMFLLKCLAIDDYVHCDISHTFGGGKLFFTEYIDPWFERYPKFKGLVRGRSGDVHPKPTHAPDEWSVKFYNGSRYICLPPDIFKGGVRLRSQRWNSCRVSEWVHFFNQKMVSKVLTACVTRPFRQKYKDRKEFYFQRSIVWESSPEYKTNPAHKRVQYYDDQIKKGDKRYIHFHYTEKDISPEFKWTYDSEQKEQDRQTMDPVDFSMEWEGEWQTPQEKIYSLSALNKIRRDFVKISFKGDPNHIYVLGIDVAKGYKGKGDDFSIALRRLGKENELDALCLMERELGMVADEMAWLVHRIIENFTVPLIVMDPGGGGTWLAETLAQAKLIHGGVEHNITPIYETTDYDKIGGHHILCFFSRGSMEITKIYGKMSGDDVLVNKGHDVLRSDIAHLKFFAPLPLKDISDKNLSPRAKQVYENIDNAFGELISIGIKKDKDGNIERTARGQFMYVAKGKKDSGYATMYAAVAADLHRRMLNFNELGDNIDQAAFATNKTEEEQTSIFQRLSEVK